MQMERHFRAPHIPQYLVHIATLQCILAYPTPLQTCTGAHDQAAKVVRIAAPLSLPSLEIHTYRARSVPPSQLNRRQPPQAAGHSLV